MFKRRPNYAGPPAGQLAAQPQLISALAPSPREQMVARVTSAALVLAFLAALPFRNAPLPRFDAFVPIDNTVLFVCSLFTATLLYGQYATARDRKLLALASGILFSGLLLIPHTLTYIGAVATRDPLAYLQAPPWLYLSRQAGILVGFACYSLFRAPATPVHGPSRGVMRSILTSVAVAVVPALTVTWITIAKTEWLPPILNDPIRTTTSYNAIILPTLVGFSFGAIIVFMRARTTILDLWVQVAAVSWVLQMWMVGLVAARYSLVFYVSRTLGMISASVVLIALFAESMMLQAKIAFAAASRDQERAGRRTAVDLMTGAIAHELRQPLTAILSNSEAGGQMLKTVPGSEEAREVFDDIGGDVRRAAQILDSIRSQFAATPGDQRPVDVNDLVRQSIKVSRVDLDARGAKVHTDLASDLPAILCHRGQLLQVLLNGLTNAGDALASITDRPRRIDVRTTNEGPRGVAILIEDSGSGIDAELAGHLFEPFHSTKERGTGLGLAISRSIVEAHGGTLSLANRPGHGALFRIDLPLDSRTRISPPPRPAPNYADLGTA